MGRRERKKGKETAVHHQREGGEGVVAVSLRKNPAFRYGAVMQQAYSSPPAAPLPFFTLKLSNKKSVVQKLLSSAIIRG